MAAAIGAAVLSRYSPPLALPRLWLMTDERMGEALWTSLAALPKGSGVVFRHYGSSDREHLFKAVQRIAKARRLVVVVAGPEKLARRWQSAGSHGRSAHRTIRLRTAPVHSFRELIAAERTGADLLFVSPVFETRSHAGAKALGRVRFGQLIRKAKTPVIALGGITKTRAKSLGGFGIWGWAAIDALTQA
jgi:thiamine-phosphate pyrophosphorylase